MLQFLPFTCFACIPLIISSTYSPGTSTKENLSNILIFPILSPLIPQFAAILPTMSFTFILSFFPKLKNSFTISPFFTFTFISFLISSFGLFLPQTIVNNAFTISSILFRSFNSSNMF